MKYMIRLLPGRCREFLLSRISTMNELPLNALRAFAMVYAHGGVRAAARELGMAHFSVSRHLG